MIRMRRIFVHESYLRAFNGLDCFRGDNGRDLAVDHCPGDGLQLGLQVSSWHHKLVPFEEDRHS